MKCIKKLSLCTLIVSVASLLNVKAASVSVDSSKAIKDNFLEDTKRAKLFRKTDFNVPDIYITMSEENLKSLIDSASVGGFDPPPGFDGNFTNGDFPPPPPFDGDFPPPDGDFPPFDGDFPPFDENFIPPKSSDEEEFKVEDATLDFVLNGEKTTIDSITISVGGQFSKNSAKLGYNIKINNGSLLGRKVFRLRSNVEDASLMRAKLSCDVLNRLGLPSVSANYARLFINDEFMGLYILIDAYKTSWVKKTFEEDEDVENLYQCKEMNSNFSTNNLKLCTNANDKYANSTESLEEFITTINSAKTREDVEDIMDVDVFVRTWIYEWLLGSWDHTLINGKNYFLYKQVNGKWVVFIYDFDSMFGHSLNFAFRNVDPLTLPFNEWYRPRYIVDVLAKNDNDTFISNLQYVIDTAFNPDVLFPHIDAIKAWISPYVIEDRTPVNGTLPGFINPNGRNRSSYSFEEFEQNIEYTSIGSGTGIKKWIEDRYNFACANYPIKCSSTPSSEISKTEEISASSTTTTDEDDTPTTTPTEDDDNAPTTTPTEDDDNTPTTTPTEDDDNAPTTTPTEDDDNTPTTTPTEDEDDTPTTTPTEDDDNTPTTTPTEDDDDTPTTTTKKDDNNSTSTTSPDKEDCWSKSMGYSCCKSCNVITADKHGSWGIENKHWCGIKPDVCKIKIDKKCWSSSYGYPCCSGCKVYYIDHSGEWGIEKGNWCGIVDSRCDGKSSKFNWWDKHTKNKNHWGW